MAVNASGRIGMGTLDPRADVHINGEALIGSAVYAGDD